MFFGMPQNILLARIKVSSSHKSRHAAPQSAENQPSTVFPVIVGDRFSQMIGMLAMEGKRCYARGSASCRAAKSAYYNVADESVQLEDHGHDVTSGGTRVGYCPTRLMGERRAGQVAPRGETWRAQRIKLQNCYSYQDDAWLSTSEFCRLQAHVLLESCASATGNG